MHSLAHIHCCPQLINAARIIRLIKPEIRYEIAYDVNMSMSTHMRHCIVQGVKFVG